jgi:hypothetical protein
MKKEMFIAILIGFLLGLIITFGVYRLRVAKNPKTGIPVATPAASTLPTTSSSQITIHSPEEGAIQEIKSATVTGSTIPDSYVVLFVTNTEYIRQSDATGNFSFDVELAEGSNLLTVNVLTDDGTVLTKERTVIVTTVYKEPPPASASPSASPSIKPTATPRATARPATSPKPSATPRPITTP